LSTEDDRDIPEALPVLNNWVRGVLVGIVLGLTVVFTVAWRLNPYLEDGTPRRMETHRQLGLPPCTFYEITGLPCPACGMTTSFALLIRGDLWHSLQANAAGTALGLFCLAVIPWAAVSVVRRQTPFVRSLEKAFMLVVLSLVTVMTMRWLLVLALHWCGITSVRI
jgi:hypothetical protein